jgi:heme oxygenase
MCDLVTLARLNTDTRPHHANADGDVEQFLFRTTPTRQDYRAFLSRLYGFLVPTEAAFQSVPGLDALLDLKLRTKTGFVLCDLLALGMTMTEVAELPHCQSVPAFRGTAAALGWMYVIERPMLACAVIRNHLETSLRAEMAFASAYFTCYAGQTGMLWRELGVVMDEVSHTHPVGDRIIASANDAFRCLERWRTYELARLWPPRYTG